MKNHAFLILLVFLFSCASEQTQKSFVSEILSIQELKKQEFMIDNNKEQTLVTENGAIIQIAPNSFNTNKQEIIIAVREAYDMESIALANLHTQSYGNPLQSGGMIEITAKDKSIALKKKVKVLIPKKNYSTKMNIFRGEKELDGSLNWVEPKSILGKKKITAFDNGETLFQANCASCHSINKDGTGPNLAGVSNRRPKEWIYSFIRNSAQLIASGDVYANCIYEYWYKTAQTAFPDLSNKEIDNILFYVDQKSAEQAGGLASNTQAHPCDSCEIYKTLMSNASTEADTKLKAVYADFEKQQTVILKNIILACGPATPLQNQVAKADRIHKELYYEFELGQLSWYNIDILIAELYKNENFNIDIRLTQEYEKQQITLLVPEILINMRGSLEKDKGYWFGNNLHIPKDLKCFLILIGEKNDKSYLDIIEFDARENQALVLKGEEIEKEKIKEKIKALKLNQYELTQDTRDRQKANAGAMPIPAATNATPIPAPTPVDLLVDELAELRSKSNQLSSQILKARKERFKKIQRFKPNGCNCNYATPPANSADEINDVSEVVNTEDGAHSVDYE